MKKILKNKILSLLVLTIFTIVNLISLNSTIVMAQDIKVSQSDIQKELNSTLEYMKKNNKDEWSAIDLQKFGVKQDASEVKNWVKTHGSKDKFSGATSYEKSIMYLVSQGYNPYNFNGMNLVNELYNNLDLKTFYTFGDAFGVFAWDFANVKGEYKNNKNVLLQELIKSKIDDNTNGVTSAAWGWGSTDIDTTATVLLALTMSDNKTKEINDLIESAVTTLSKLQNDNGCYTNAWVGGDSSESISFTILSLTAAGVDPQGEKFSKNGENLVSALLKFKGENGTFKHLKKDTEDNYMATEEAFRALIALNEFYKGNKAPYNFYKTDINALKLPVYKEETKNLEDIIIKGEEATIPLKDKDLDQKVIIETNNGKASFILRDLGLTVLDNNKDLKVKFNSKDIDKNNSAFSFLASLIQANDEQALIAFDEPVKIQVKNNLNPNAEKYMLNEKLSDGTYNELKEISPQNDGNFLVDVFEPREYKIEAIGDKSQDTKDENKTPQDNKNTNSNDKNQNNNKPLDDNKTSQSYVKSTSKEALEKSNAELKLPQTGSMVNPSSTIALGSLFLLAGCIMLIRKSAK